MRGALGKKEDIKKDKVYIKTMHKQRIHIKKCGNKEFRLNYILFFRIVPEDDRKINLLAFGSSLDKTEEEKNRVKITRL